MKLTKLMAREVLDSRGNPTVEVDAELDGGTRGRAIAPSGASTGKHEAVELRDGDANRFGGKGVLRAVANVNGPIASELVGKEVASQFEFDQRLRSLDTSDNCSRLGANAILAVSLAVAQARAGRLNLPLYRSLWTERASLPLPMVNMISGGLHAGGQIEFQDFLILPVGAKSYSQALQWIVKVYRHLGRVLYVRGLEATLVGDEGGYGPRLASNREALDAVMSAIESAGLTPGSDVAIGIDVASTHFYREGRYWLRLGRDEALDLDADAMIALLAEWVDTYPIVSIEDGLAEDDWEGWKKLTAALGSRLQLLGDDLIVTNPGRLQRCIREGVANAVLIKLNQIGDLSQTLSVIDQARRAGYNTVVSARSGETEDTFIADLAVATGAGQIKIGSIVRGERLAKYNQLLRIEEELRDSTPFAGADPFRLFRRS